MQVTCYPYSLQFIYPFRLAHGTRTHTPCVYVKLQDDGFTAWGEATLPPYLPETQQSVIYFVQSFAKKMKGQPNDSWALELSKAKTDMSARAALDMALWSLRAQQCGKTVAELMGNTSYESPPATYTLAGGTTEEMKEKIAFAMANGFRMFKLKLDGKNDEALVRTYKKLTDCCYAVDVNQGWSSLAVAQRMIDFLNEQDCLLVEQPLPKDMWQEMSKLKSFSPLPLYADESLQRWVDVERVAACFHGVNIKLMKCGGLTEALEIVSTAQSFELKLLIGCMSESSVGCLAASPLVKYANFADLDGPFLINNDLFGGMKVQDGVLSPQPLAFSEAGKQYFSSTDGFEF